MIILFDLVLKDTKEENSKFSCGSLFLKKNPPEKQKYIQIFVNILCINQNFNPTYQ